MKKKTTEKKEKKAVSLTLHVNNTDFHTEGDTVEEALNVFDQAFFVHKIYPLKTRAVITAIKGKNEANFPVLARELRMIMMNKTTKEIFAKRFTMGLK